MSHLEIEDSYPPLSQQDLLQFEQHLGVRLPDDYRQFLLAHNGGTPTHSFFPITGNPADDHGMLDRFLGLADGKYNDLRSLLRVFHARIPPHFLPIARDPGGNLICLSIAGADAGAVYFWDHEEEVDEGEVPSYENVYAIAPNFTKFLDSLTEHID